MNQQLRSWKEIPIAGVCWKSSTEYKTGDWRSYRPVWKKENCTRCMFCHIYCPEGAIKHDSKTDVMIFDFNFCKGCGICANECPANAVEMVLEGKE
jgi:pyruvate ferredoxin oxidoreductase delta subunit